MSIIGGEEDFNAQTVAPWGFDSVDDPSTKLSLETSAPTEGAKSLLVTLGTNTDDRQGQFDFTAYIAEAIIGLKFEYDPNGCDWNAVLDTLASFRDGSVTEGGVLDASTAAGPQQTLRLELEEDGGGNTVGQTIEITDDNHTIMVIMKKATGSTAVNGSLELWIDNLLEDILRGFDIHAEFDGLDNIRYGAKAPSAGASGAFILDKASASDDPLVDYAAFMSAHPPINFTAQTADLSEFTSTATGGGTLTNISPGMGSANHAWEFNVSSVGNVKGFITPIRAKAMDDVFWFGIMLNADGLTMTNGDVFDFFRGNKSVGGGVRIQGQLRQDTGVKQIRMSQDDDDAAGNFTGWHTISGDTWMSVRIQSATGSVSPNGTMEFYINDALVETETVIDNVDLGEKIQEWEIGVVSGVDATTTGPLLMSDFKVVYEDVKPTKPEYGFPVMSSAIF